ncbi:exported hypothetical protein [uncultured delta proteobacterium]|uniref:Translocation and assembly module TamB C-terminal domain-containing protein n=1 Tax=uncultured delta proteobacterium TaxID=34034 RepID=A0A212JGK3_9DELT|nr:exported hypothetical protein [uncultured delta proteobacterium]
MRIPAKKILRISGLVLGGILLVLCLAVATVLVWLRTGSGERFVADFAAKSLADQGLFLTMDGLEGPLPSRVLLTNVSLADAKGTWFAAKELELVLSLGDLFRLTGAVSLARVDTPEVFRLPELPPSPPAATPPAEEAKTSSPYFSLPVAVRLDTLAIENLGIYAPLVFPDAPQGSGPLLRASLHGSAKAEAEHPLTAEASLDASVADIQALAAQVQSPVPLAGFSLTVNANATIGATIDATVKGTATPEAWNEKLPIDYGLQAGLAGAKAALQSAFLDGLGLRLDAVGGADLETLAASAKTTLTTQAGGKWETVVARLAGQDMGGSVTAALEASVDGDKKIAATADLSGTAMRWGSDELQRILGPQFTVKATADGSESTRFALNLATLEAGAVSASGSGSFALKDKALSAAFEAALSDIKAAAPGVEGALRAKLNASGTLDAPAATLEVASDAIKTDAASVANLRANATLSGTLKAPAATLDATVDAITAQAASLRAVAAKARLSGTLAAPVFSLEATSESIKTQAGEFKQFRAGIDGTASLPEGAEKTVDTKAGVTLGASPAGPVALHTALAAAQKTDGAVTARLSGLDLTLAGTALAADITAAIPPPGPNSGAGAVLPSLNGTASATVTDWKPIAALSGVPIAGGKAGFDAKFTHSANAQQITASLRAEALSLPDAFAINGLSGTVEARDLANPDVALNLALGKGEAGPVTWQTGAVAVTAKQGKGAFAAALRTDKTASQAVASAPKGAPAQPGKAERLTVAGSFALSPMRVTLDRLAARVPDSPMGIYLTAPATVDLGDAVKVKNLKLNVVPGNGAIALDAALAGGNADLTATVTEFPFRLIREAVQAPVPDGTLSAEAVIKKSGAAVQGKIDAKAVVTAPAVGKAKTPAVAFILASTLDQRADPNFPQLKSGGGISRLRGSLNVGFEGSQTAPNQAAKTPANSPDAQIHFNVPLRFAANGAPEPAMTAPLGAKVAWRGEIAPLWALAPVPDRNLSGLAQVDAEVKGPMEKPEYTVNAYVANGRFEDSILGVLLTNIAVEAASASSGDSKLLMRAEDGMGGYVALEGALSSPGQPAGNAVSSAPRITARGHINHLQPLHRDDIFLRLSGKLSVDGPLDTMKVAADVEVERGELSIAKLAGGVRTLEITDPAAQQEKPSSGPELDVKVAIPHRFYIRGRGLDSEWAGNLAVKGKASAPSLTGSLKPVRGTFDLMSRPFAFSGGDIAFMGGDRIDPGLNLNLTYDGPNIMAIVRATGTASKPEIKMESQPSLPQDQIMAEVLFGKEFSKLSRFEALQVANSLRQLANIGGDGLDPLATMRTKLGIDMLRVGSSGGETGDNRSVSGAPGAGTVGGGGNGSSGGGSDSAATPTLEAGKYINDAIYVGVEQGATADSTGVRIEVELRPNLSLQGKTTSNSSQIGLGWKKDY